MPTVLRAARANLLLAPVGTLLAVFSSILVARWLGPGTYADYATLMALMAWLLLLAESGCNAGLGRFLGEAGVRNARGSLYLSLQYRRWTISLILTLSLIWLGPMWARSVSLSEAHWQPFSFVMVGLLAAVMLHGQLASSAMLTAFRHKRVLLTNQLMTFARALVLVLLAGTLREPLVLVAALLSLAIVEALILHRAAAAQIGHERGRLPRDMVNAAQKHGLVALVDKMTTALSAGPFLLLVLAGAHGRGELAMLAIATDLLQKALSVIGLPLSNIVMPMLNESRSDAERFRRQVARLGGLMVVLFAVATGGILTVLPVGLPLLLGPSYNLAVPIAMIWLLPVFFESGVRMVWGAALVALDQYRWLMRFNLVYGVASLLVIFVSRDSDLMTLLWLLGMLRFFMSLVLLGRAAQLTLLPPESRPLRVIVVAGAACVLSLGVQTLLDPVPLIFRLLAGIGVYLLAVLASLRWLSLIPEPSHDALYQIAGKYKGLLMRIIPPVPEDRRNA
ncbi:MAG: oligosaccharide flippase family protein [Thiobacillus sp.]|nr:oligosaccharide flippase family protein [Thiobacillus sp.]